MWKYPSAHLFQTAEFCTLGEFQGETMRTISFYAAVLFCAFHIGRPTAFAQITDEISTASLTGLTGFALSIGELSPGVEGDGLTAEQLRADAVSKLKTAGVRLIPETGWVDSAGGAQLYLEVNTLKYGAAQYSYSIQLSVIQKVLLSRDASRPTLATTRSASVMGVVGAAKMAASVREQAGVQLDQLISRYLLANRPPEK
jgi:hypothetical protein